MDANLLFGYALLAIGVFAMASGIAISLIDALRPAAAPESVPETIKGLLDAIAKVLAELAKFRPGMQLMLVGLAIFAIGGWVLSAQPL